MSKLQPQSLPHVSGANATYVTTALQYVPLLLGVAVVNFLGVALLLTDLWSSGRHGASLIFVAIAGWLDYWWLFRIAYRLDLAGPRLSWRSLFLQGDIAVQDLRRIRPFRAGPGFVVFEVGAGRRPLIVPVYKGLDEFVGIVSDQRPDLPIRLGWVSRLYSALPIWSHFRTKKPS